MVIISERVKEIRESATLSFDKKVKERLAAGKETYELHRGAPDFDMPLEAQKEVSRAREGYSDVRGLLNLRKAISQKVKEDQGLDYDPSQILVSAGSKMSLYLAFQSILNKGDEVLLSSPYWLSYPSQIKLAGGIPVEVPTKDFKLDIDAIKEKATDKTKAIVINTPNNPTGVVLGREEVHDLAEFAIDKGIFLIEDEAYEKFVYDETKHYSAAMLFDAEGKENILKVGSFSKTYSMPGLRVGYALGPQELIDAMSKLQSQIYSHASVSSQRAALAAITSQTFNLKEIMEEYNKRRLTMLEGLRKLGLITYAPQGSFFVLADISEHGTSVEVSNKLLDAGIAVTPTEDFGSNNHVRMSYANTQEKIREGFEQMGDVFQ